MTPSAAFNRPIFKPREVKAADNVPKRLSERVIAGMPKAAAKGTKSGNPIGRPRVDAETEKAIQRLLRTGTGIHKTARTVGVGTATVQRIRAEMGSGPFEVAA